jgi:protein-disulfide isomerase
VIARPATRRLALAGVLALGAAPFAKADAAAGFTPEPDDMAIGNRRARVTVVEYASVGCPHCAHWNAEVFPAFKAKYVDAGKVRFVVREMLTGDPSIAAAGFLTARCAGPDKYFQVIDEVYRRQGEIYQSGAVMRDVAADAGLSGDAYTACLSDQAAVTALNARTQRHVDVDKVDSTPTFEINGQRHEGFMTLDQLDAAIHDAAHRRR